MLPFTDIFPVKVPPHAWKESVAMINTVHTKIPNVFILTPAYWNILFFMATFAIYTI